MVYIRTKTIKGNQYYYEQHSIRSGNKVKTQHIRYVGSVNTNNNRELGTTQVNEYDKKAIDRYGYTENEKEAGYILKDGKMLDFSGRFHATGYENKKPKKNEPDYLKNSRSEDHRDIRNIFSEKEKEKDTGYDYIKDYGEKTGSARFTFINGDSNIEFFKKPTREQITRLKSIQYKNKGKIYADLTYKKDFNGKEKSVYGGTTKEYNSIEELEKDL